MCLIDDEEDGRRVEVAHEREAQRFDAVVDVDAAEGGCYVETCGGREGGCGV